MLESTSPRDNFFFEIDSDLVYKHVKKIDHMVRISFVRSIWTERAPKVCAFLISSLRTFDMNDVSSNGSGGKKKKDE